MSNPPVHCSSCALGISRSRSVNFAPVRKRRKGGGASELSSAELPLIRPFASLASISRVRGSARYLWRTRVYIVARDGRAATDWCVFPARLTSELSRSIEIARSPANFLESVGIAVALSRSFISLEFVELCRGVFFGIRVGWIISTAVPFEARDEIVKNSKVLLVNWDFVRT